MNIFQSPINNAYYTVEVEGPRYKRLHYSLTSLSDNLYDNEDPIRPLMKG